MVGDYLQHLEEDDPEMLEYFLTEAKTRGLINPQKVRGNLIAKHKKSHSAMGNYEPSAMAQSGRLYGNNIIRENRESHRKYQNSL